MTEKNRLIAEREESMRVLGEDIQSRDVSLQTLKEDTQMQQSRRFDAEERLDLKIQEMTKRDEVLMDQIFLACQDEDDPFGVALDLADSVQVLVDAFTALKEAQGNQKVVMQQELLDDSQISSPRITGTMQSQFATTLPTVNPWNLFGKLDSQVTTSINPRKFLLHSPILSSGVPEQEGKEKTMVDCTNLRIQDESPQQQTDEVVVGRTQIEETTVCQSVPNSGSSRGHDLDGRYQSNAIHPFFQADQESAPTSNNGRVMLPNTPIKYAAAGRPSTTQPSMNTSARKTGPHNNRVGLVAGRTEEWSNEPGTTSSRLGMGHQSNRRITTPGEIVKLGNRVEFSTDSHVISAYRGAISGRSENSNARDTMVTANGDKLLASNGLSINQASPSPSKATAASSRARLLPPVNKFAAAARRQANLRAVPETNSTNPTRTRISPPKGIMKHPDSSKRTATEAALPTRQPTIRRRVSKIETKGLGPVIPESQSPSNATGRKKTNYGRKSQRRGTGGYDCGLERCGC